MHTFLSMSNTEFDLFCTSINGFFENSLCSKINMLFSVNRSSGKKLNRVLGQFASDNLTYSNLLLWGDTSMFWFDIISNCAWYLSGSKIIVATSFSSCCIRLRNLTVFCQRSILKFDKTSMPMMAL